MDESGLSLTLAKEQAQVRALGEGLIGRKEISSEKEGFLPGIFLVF